MKRKVTATVWAMPYAGTVTATDPQDLYVFDAGTGHEFRAPLGSVGWAAKVLMVGIVHDIDPADPFMLKRR